MKTSIWMGMIVVLCTTASGAVVVDGNVSDWDPAYIFEDPNPDNPGSVEMTRWGARVEGDYLYWFCEINQNWTDFQGTAGTKDRKIFPGLWIDADYSTTTYLADGDDANCADAGKGEWSENHRGIDVNLELGLIGNWVNGSNTGPGGEGPDGSMYNYWGLNDNVADIQSVVSSGSWYSDGQVMEACVLLSEIEAVIAGMYDGVVPGDCWLVAVGVQGTNRDDIGYGYDVGTPRIIEMSSGIPEPITLSLLGVGALALLKRRER